jgi:hypothetical protein
LAFLIKDQWNKSVPQSLAEFIPIAYNLNSNLHNAYSENAKKQGDKFDKFLKVYNACKNELFTKVTQTIAEN